ncbi:MAG: hypothetical protein WD232_00555 [Acidimicrobiales bacterium]
MTISDETRYQLRQRLDVVLGPDDAATLMAHLPPVGWADVATKRDLDHLATVFDAKLATGLAEVRTELRTGLAELRVELHEQIGGVHEQIGGVRQEIGGVRQEIGELHEQIGGARQEIGGVHEQIGGLHKEIGGVRQEIGSQTWTLLLGVAGLQISGVLAVVGLSNVL